MQEDSYSILISYINKNSPILVFPEEITDEQLIELSSLLLERTEGLKEVKLYALGGNIQKLFKSFNKLVEEYKIFEVAGSFEEAEQFVKGINNKIFTSNPFIFSEETLSQIETHYNELTLPIEERDSFGCLKYSNDYSIKPKITKDSNNLSTILYEGCEQEMLMLAKNSTLLKLVQTIHLFNKIREDTEPILEMFLDLPKLRLSYFSSLEPDTGDSLVNAIINGKAKKLLVYVNAESKHLEKLLSIKTNNPALSIDNIFNNEAIASLLKSFKNSNNINLNNLLLQASDEIVTSIDADVFYNNGFLELFNNIKNCVEKLILTNFPPNKKFVQLICSALSNTNNKVRGITLSKANLDIEDFKALLDVLASPNRGSGSIYISLQLNLNDPYYGLPGFGPMFRNLVLQADMPKYVQNLSDTLTNSKLICSLLSLDLKFIDHQNKTNSFLNSDDVLNIIKLVINHQPNIKSLYFTYNPAEATTDFKEKVIELINNPLYKLINLALYDGHNTVDRFNNYDVKLSPINKSIYNALQSNKNMAYFSDYPMPKALFLKETAEFIVDKNYHLENNTNIDEIMYFTHLRRYIKFKITLESILAGEFYQGVDQDFINCIDDNYFFALTIFKPKYIPTEENFKRAKDAKNADWLEILENNSQAPFFTLPHEIMSKIADYLLHDYKPVEFAGEVSVKGSSDALTL